MVLGMYEQYTMLALPDKSQPVKFSTEMSFYDIISNHDGKNILLRMILHIVRHCYTCAAWMKHNDVI